MRRLGLVVALALVSLTVTSCGGGNGPRFADVAWQVRCPSMPPAGYSGCPQDSPGRDVSNVDGEAGHSVSCSVSSSGSLKILSFRVYSGSEYGIQVDGAAFDPSSGNLSGAGCTMRVLESGNSYQGTCGANPPTDAQQCQITGVSIMDAMSGPQVTGSILCRNIKAPVDPSMLVRDVTSGGTSPSARSQPFMFTLENCDGL